MASNGKVTKKCSEAIDLESAGLFIEKALTQLDKFSNKTLRATQKKRS